MSRRKELAEAFGNLRYAWLTLLCVFRYARKHKPALLTVSDLRNVKRNDRQNNYMT